MKKALIILAVLLSYSLGLAQSNSFDSVSFRELNEQSAQVWTALVQQKGTKAAAESLKSEKTLSPNVRALAQQLRQFLISSQVHFEQLRANVNNGEVTSLLGAPMHQLLRHLLMNSVLLDIAVIVNETKPGFFSPDSHRQRIIDLYARSFESTDPFANIRHKLKMSGPNPYEHLTVPVRSTALAGLLLDASQGGDCADIVSLSWLVQARRYIISFSVGPDSTEIFKGRPIASLNDTIECAHDYVLAEIKKQNYRVMEKTASLGETEYSNKELIKMARNLFGE
ncbi:hypothetical protein [Bdellovibrio sp. HCB2-146]|uniref:hypothetical protein n=1 Tax=Bdellovibrio sp. HCB2-146 TaxID=3394362 RepID=UPI0039BC850B